MPKIIGAEAGHRVEGRWILAPLSDILTPKSRRICFGPRWWLLTKDEEAIFFEHYTSPQCHSNEAMAKYLLGDRPANQALQCPATHIQLVEMVFLPHNCSDYV